MFRQISTVSSEFYYCLPQSGYEYERLRPLDSEHTIAQKLANIEELLELQYAGQVLLAAQHRHRGKSCWPHSTGTEVRAAGCSAQAQR